MKVAFTQQSFIPVEFNLCLIVPHKDKITHIFCEFEFYASAQNKLIWVGISSEAKFVGFFSSSSSSSSSFFVFFKVGY